VKEREGGREGEREKKSVGGRERERAREREGGRERERERERRRDGWGERERERERERGRERERERERRRDGGRESAREKERAFIGSINNGGSREFFTNSSPSRGAWGPGRRRLAARHCTRMQGWTVSVLMISVPF
jgi:hypothetical protein